MRRRDVNNMWKRAQALAGTPDMPLADFQRMLLNCGVMAGDLEGDNHTRWNLFIARFGLDRSRDWANTKPRTLTEVLREAQTGMSRPPVTTRWEVAHQIDKLLCSLKSRILAEWEQRHQWQAWANSMMAQGRGRAIRFTDTRLSYRTVDILWKAEIYFLQRLAKKTQCELFQLGRFHYGSLREVTAYLAERGVWLTRGDLPIEWPYPVVLRCGQGGHLEPDPRPDDELDLQQLIARRTFQTRFMRLTEAQRAMLTVRFGLDGNTPQERTAVAAQFNTDWRAVLQLERYAERMYLGPMLYPRMG